LVEYKLFYVEKIPSTEINDRNSEKD